VSARWPMSQAAWNRHAATAVLTSAADPVFEEPLSPEDEEAAYVSAGHALEFAVPNQGHMHVPQPRESQGSQHALF
jgi:hypothetical protein